MSCRKKDISIEFSPTFRRTFKKLAKRYRSLALDLEAFVHSVSEDPLRGADLGNGLRKVRMTITSKGKGKSGGARVITCTLSLSEDGTIYFLTIYDKSEKESISDKELQALLEEIGRKVEAHGGK